MSRRWPLDPQALLDLGVERVPQAQREERVQRGQRGLWVPVDRLVEPGLRDRPAPPEGRVLRVRLDQPVEPEPRVSRVRRGRRGLKVQRVLQAPPVPRGLVLQDRPAQQAQRGQPEAPGPRGQQGPRVLPVWVRRDRPELPVQQDRRVLRVRASPT